MRRKKGWMKLKVKKIRQETPDTETFFFVNEEEDERAFDYIAGQYLTFRFDDIGDKPLVRSYTMSSSPKKHDEALVSVKRVYKGVVSNWMCDEIKEGTILRARGPIGKFCYLDGDNEHLVMTAGGSGVTPFVSIMLEHLETLGQEGSPKKMTLIVSYKSKNDLILWEDLKTINAVEGARVVTSLTREDATSEGFLQGRIDDEMIAKVMEGDYKNTTFMSCGPIPMMDLTVAHAKANGVPEEHCKVESFES
jgi:glycine betaine catabolism B